MLHVRRLVDAVVGVLAGAEVLGVHAPVAFDRARSGDNVEDGFDVRSCSGLEERAQDHDLEGRVERHDRLCTGSGLYVRARVRVRVRVRVRSA